MLSRVLFYLSLTAFLGTALLGAGVLFERAKPWPHAQLESLVAVVKRYVRFGALVPDNLLTELPLNSSGELLTLHQPDRLEPGYIAFLGYSKALEDFAVTTLDLEGRVVARFALNYQSVDSDGPSGGSNAPHAFLRMPDGGYIVNFDQGDYLIRYNQCGDVIWSTEGAFHHSLALDDTGGVWTWLGEISAYSQYQYIVRVDPETGRIDKKIGLYEDIIGSSPGNRLLFGLVSDDKLDHETHYASVEDRFHPNDVTILQADLAKQFPQWQIGDLLISIRELDLIALIDVNTLAVKWRRQGPWVEQHDPDFRADGKISVFNNNTIGTRSEITIIDPRTDEVSALATDSSSGFFSSRQGKHSFLADGSIQVTVPGEGRVLIFGADGQLILEINNLYSASANANVSDATYIPMTDTNRIPLAGEC